MPDNTPAPSVQRQFYLASDFVRDVTGIAGSAACAYGAWLHYQPLGFMVGGGLFVLLAVVSAFTTGKR